MFLTTALYAALAALIILALAANVVRLRLRHGGHQLVGRHGTAVRKCAAQRLRKKVARRAGVAGHRGFYITRLVRVRIALDSK